MITDVLPRHPLYVDDRDDDFDATYATIRFRLPEAMREELARFARPADAPDSSERWKAMLKKVHDEPESPEAHRAAAAFKPVFDKLEEMSKAGT